MEQRAEESFKEEDFRLPDPFVKNRKRRSRDFHIPKGETTKRYALDPFSEGTQAGSITLRDPFKEYVHPAETLTDGSRNQAGRAVSVNNIIGNAISIKLKIRLTVTE